MKRVKRNTVLPVLILLLSIGMVGLGGTASENNNTQTLPQYVLDQAPFLGGDYVLYLSWRTGNITDSQNLKMHLLENFKIYMNQSSIPEDIIPEILDTITNITAGNDLKDKNFNPDKDKFKAHISYNKLRLTELDADTRVFTPPWWDAKEINLSSPVVKSLIDACGSTDGIRVIEFVPAKDVSNLTSIDNASVQILAALNSGYSLVIQNNLMNPEVRNAVILINRNISVNKSSRLNYMVLGDNEDAANCILNRISDAGGVSSFSNSMDERHPSNLIVDEPIAPVPELTTLALVSAGILGLIAVRRWN